MEIKPATTTKDKDATVKFPFDFTTWLNGGEVSSHTVTTDLTSSSNQTTSSVTVTLSGGVKGRTYPLVVRVTTTDGQVDDAEISVLIV